MKTIKKLLHITKMFISKTSSSKFEKFLRSKGCIIGKNIFWCKVWTLDFDITRPVLIEIQDNVMINSYVTIMTHDSVSHVFRHLYHDFLPSSGLVRICKNAYIGRNTTILKGVTIGENSIIGYGSLVTKSIPANCVAAGRPAKVICTVDEYYEKRKKTSLEEAFAYARRIFEVTGNRPTMQQMYEEFPFYLDGDTEDPGLPLSVKYQTRGFYDEWRTNHKAPFDSFEDFLKAAGL